ncbi:MAG: nuclease, partial [Thermoleophilia bacterium]|nr:nuclease [Thermoleophilia bacterium]
TPTAGTELRVAQFNVENFFDTVDDKNHTDDVKTKDAYELKLSKLSLTIRDTLKGADIISMEEVENEGVLQDLVKRPELAALGYKTLLVEGNDKRGIDNALIYRGDKVELLKSETVNPKSPDGLKPAGGSIDPTLLFPRPPLIATFRVQGAASAVAGANELTVIVNHFKSMAGEKKPGDSARRDLEGKFLGEYVDQRLAKNAAENILVTGDLNALPGTKALEDLEKHADGSVRLIDTPTRIAKEDRWSHEFQGDKNLLDHQYVTPGLDKLVTGAEIYHINAGERGGENSQDPSVPNGTSDHDPLLTTFRF